MVTPFLLARQHWRSPEYLHPSLEPALKETHGVVVFHEQVLKIVAETTGVTLAQADEVRRALGSPQGQLDVEAWWRPAAAARGYRVEDVNRIWEVLKAFASFGFCKAHAAAFALPTYQSAWLKAHHPAAFLSGVLTHDPGMYPKRLILDDARNLGIAILGLDVNASGESYLVERVAPWSQGDSERQPDADLPDGRAYGIRLSLADVKGISDAEVQRIVAGQQYFTIADFWHRAQVSRPVVERLVLAGGFDSLYGLSGTAVKVSSGSGYDWATWSGDPTRPLVACGRARPVVFCYIHFNVDAPIRSQGDTSYVPSRGSRGDPRSDPDTGDQRRDARRATSGGVAVPKRTARHTGSGAAHSAHLRPGGHPRAHHGHRSARDDGAGAGPGRAGHPRAGRQRPHHRLLRPDAAGARSDSIRPAARATQSLRAVGRRGQGRHADPADPLGSTCGVPDP